jgi:membrane protease YdiL (CAAX protease family)
MNKEPNVPESTEVARRSKRATLSSLIIGSILFTFLIIGLSIVVRSQFIGNTVKIMALITVTLGMLFFGLALIGDQMVRKYHWRWDGSIMILVWVYLLPAGYLLCISLAFTLSAPSLYRSFVGFSRTLVTQVPILWLWQGLMLSWFLLRVNRLNPSNIFPMKGEDVILAGLAGLGLALAAIFSISILSNLFPTLLPQNPDTFNINGIMTLIILAFALSLFPWAEEQYFRGLLPDELSGKLGRTAGVGLSAFLFALLTFRWFYFIPLFIIGLGLGTLKEKRGLPSAVIAHIVCNLIVLGLFNSFLF